ncbi:MAG: GNAT family N-acetyltransferase [bacterium]|nr:GNAT family N-acetyltransferase [bacterium]
MPQLVLPSSRYQRSFIDAVREYHAEGRYTELDIPWLEQHFDAFVADRLSRVTQAAPGKVRESILWLVEGDEFLGRVSIRHDLNDMLRAFGGHIGYDVRPSQRQRGYGTLMLKLALEEARTLGLSRVMLTCDSTNEASRRIIQSNGGQFEDERLLDGRDVPTQRWWIDIPGEWRVLGSAM